VAVNILTYQALTNKKIKLFGGEQMRPHIHINDMHRLCLDAVKRPQHYQGVFNAGFENLTNRELAETVAAVTGAAVERTTSDDNRSYRLCSDRLLKTGFAPKHSVREAIGDPSAAFAKGTLKDRPESRSVEWLKRRAA
jgi:nucleoside-diphosphate-sugar epimerase